ncbi:formimidoylglutamase [Veronia pacifica]|uniref:Formimidoylglutamase n=1 Tax=Veronia pacifica TaxID=1080227 RepID=A0A1C3EME6_9GAMM|nr:formimidoylglutamase [Veronia pacifica]ODA34395.1 formimidoylglutamase [Veronia pacifica]
MSIDLSAWTGRSDPEDGDLGLRLHNKVQSAEEATHPGTMILGFACDEGVARNKGRVGAYNGPTEVRKALANLAWHHHGYLYDGGDTRCDDHDLAKAQRILAADISEALRQQHFPIIIGGGHEIAWASFQGLANHLQQKGTERAPRVGIINFDAHFDLRTPSGESAHGSSGTPFAQVAEYCHNRQWPFEYACLGVSSTSNTQALFKKANDLSVLTVEDTEFNERNFDSITARLSEFIERCDWLYLTIDLDVFPAAVAPGVSAPAPHGVAYPMVEALLSLILNAKNADGDRKIRLADIAEYNPRFDIDGHTARLAARLIWTIARNLPAFHEQQGVI